MEECQHFEQMIAFVGIFHLMKARMRAADDYVQRV
jgi:hypothetical protein